MAVCSLDSVLSCLDSPLLHPTLLSFIPLPEVVVMQTVKDGFVRTGTSQCICQWYFLIFLIFRARFSDGKLKSVSKLEIDEITVISLRLLCPQFNIIWNRIMFPWCRDLNFLSQELLFSQSQYLIFPLPFPVICSSPSLSLCCICSFYSGWLFNQPEFFPM